MNQAVFYKCCAFIINVKHACTAKVQLVTAQTRHLVFFIVASCLIEFAITDVNNET